MRIASYPCFIVSQLPGCCLCRALGANRIAFLTLKLYFTAFIGFMLPNWPFRHWNHVCAWFATCCFVTVPARSVSKNKVIFLSLESRFLPLGNPVDFLRCLSLTRLDVIKLLKGLWGRICENCSNQKSCFVFQVCQITAQPPMQAELLLRFQQLQSRLATLKIENEEVRQP